MKTVVAFGTFDLLHPGHLSYLTQARKFGDRLIVVIARDRNAKKAKGHIQRFSEKERKSIVGALAVVDKVVLGNYGEPLAIIRTLRPDIICLGYDHEVDEQTLAEKLKQTMKKIPRIVRAKAFHPEKYKSSKL